MYIQEVARHALVDVALPAIVKGGDLAVAVAIWLVQPDPAAIRAVALLVVSRKAAGGAAACLLVHPPVDARVGVGPRGGEGMGLGRRAISLDLFMVLFSNMWNPLSFLL